MHTFIGPDLQEVKRIVKLPFCDYLKTAVRLEERAAAAGGAVSGGHRIEQHAIPDAAMQDLLEVTFERYFSTASLLGTVDTCQAMVSRLEACDVDEVACLIDFGPSDEQVMASLHSVDRLREACGADARARAEADAINEFSESIL